MRFKVLTPDCPTCTLVKVNDQNQLECHWGRGKPKILKENKGKKPYFCRLKRDL